MPNSIIKIIRILINTSIYISLLFNRKQTSVYLFFNLMATHASSGVLLKKSEHYPFKLYIDIFTYRMYNLQFKLSLVDQNVNLIMVLYVKILGHF